LSLRTSIIAIGYLFATQGGQPYTANGFGANWQLTLKRAGISGVTFHDLRRWAITEAQRLGGVDYAQAVGVHKGRQATERYIVAGESVVRPLR
jgi:integrase